MSLKQNLFTTALLFAVVGYAGSLPAGNPKPQTAKKLYQRMGNEGIINGTVLFSGQRPKEWMIDTSADPACRITNPNPQTEFIVGSKGRLANVFVYIKGGGDLDELSFETPGTTVRLDQQGCRFVPHVLGVQTNQTLEVANSDPTTHNVHPQPKTNVESNRTHVSGAPPLRQQFRDAEVMIPIKCNQHPWMKAYVGVLSHPFFSVSDENGMFKIEGLPPGNYILAAWHEKLGEKIMEVNLAPYSQQQVNFTFNPVPD
jgi:hypothetical protein